MLGVVRVEHRVGEHCIGTQQCGERAVGSGDGVERGDIGSLAGQGLEQGGDVGGTGRLVEGDALHARGNRTQVVTGDGLVGLDLDGVEEAGGQHFDAGLLQAFNQNAGEAVDALGDGLQALRAVIDSVHAGHVGEQHLRGADVGVGLFAADVLFARLQRHAVSGLAARILGDADDAARHGADVGFAGGEEGGVRAAEAHRDAEALAGAEGDVGAHGARRLEEHQRHQVGGDGHGGALGLEAGDEVGEVAHFAVVARVLQQGAEEFAVFLRVDRVDDQFKAEIGGSGLHDVDGLREAVGIDQEAVGLGLGGAAGHGHGFGGGSGFVEQRGVGDLQAGQVDHHLLEVHQRLEAALGDFSLIGRVGGVPARVFHDVAQDDLGRQGVVVAHADAGTGNHVLAGNGFQFGQGFVLALRGGQRQVCRQADSCGNGLVDQLVEAGSADGGQHLGGFGGARPDVAPDELVVLFKGGK